MNARFCADCGLKSTDHTPVGEYTSGGHWPYHPRLLCMGCLAARRARGERWERAG